MKQIAVIIPSYEPDHRLIDLLHKLDEKKIGPVCLVNDGSKSEYDSIFAEAEQIIKKQKGVLLLHKVNCGKGRALKTAFEYVLKQMPEISGVVTADSDGQHTPESILAVEEALKENPKNLILGVRKFDGEGVPWKSRMGNHITEKVFAYVSGIHVSDTQTGLRGIPAPFMKELLAVKGERFEFEMRMLLESAGKYPVTEVPIETVYDSAENHQTHFNPWKDSIRIYRILGESFLKFIFSSFSSSILDLVLFTVFCALLKNMQPFWYTALATVAARIISAAYNYAVNYRMVFKSNESVGKSAVRYALLAVIQMSLSAVIVTGAVHLIPVLPETFVKILVDTILFFISYRIQKKYVFMKK